MVQENCRDGSGWWRVKNVQLHMKKTVEVQVHDGARRWH